MRNLISFFVKQSFFFTFLILEFISFFLLINSLHYQRSVFVNSSNVFVGNIYKGVHDLTSYFYLATENKKLAEENARLKSNSLNNFKKLYSNNTIINDTVFNQKYVYTNAHIVNNEVTFQNNFITIDKGYIQNIKPGMGVVMSDGVVGIVKNVSNHFSTVMSLVNTEMQISVRLKKNYYFGSLSWPGINYHYCKMINLPGNVNIKKGDTVVTSGYSTIFPENIPIGTIETFHIPEGQSFYDIKVKLFLDFKDLHHVYVVKNLLKDEIDTLESETKH